MSATIQTLKQKAKASIMFAAPTLRPFSIAISCAALAGELLPEFEAKPFVVTALAISIAVNSWGYAKLRRWVKR